MIRNIGLSLSSAALIAFVVGSVWLAMKSPMHDRLWKTEYAQLPRVELDGDVATVRNVRNFSYDADGGVRVARYEDRSYDLASLTGVWYGISHFYDYGLAHTFLSFAFADGQYMVISVEARQEVGESYHPVTGLLRNYELIYVVGDERDIVGLRTHIRKERVYFYELRLPLATARRVLGELIERINQIHDAPEFYNTITDNCTTSLFRHAERVSTFDMYTDYRIILPGYSDALGYELGVIATDAPLDEVRARARIEPAGFGLDDPAFSAKIRKL